MTIPLATSGLPLTAMLPTERSLSSPVVELGGLERIGGASSTEAPAVSFAERLGELLTETTGLSERADLASAGLMRGDHQDVHGTMIAMQEADVAFRLVGSIRNRAIEAYREVMRMGA